MLYPVILSGGVGQRLWPVSNQNDPKQFKAFLDDKTLLQNTYQRLLKSFSQTDIFLVTSAKTVASVKAQIDIKEKNIFVEPEGKGTAIAVALAALRLQSIDPEASLVTINTDNFVREEDKYLKIIKKASEVLAKYSDRLIILGIKPSYPETGYGYIELAEAIDKDVYRVKSLQEKPDLNTAKKYLEAGNYLWSSSVFVFKAKQLLDWYQQFLPDLYQALMQIKDNDSRENMAKVYAKVKNISIDYALLEKLTNMLCIPAEVTWADIGHWRSLRDVLKKGNSNVSNTKNLVTIDSHNNLLYSFSDKKLVTAVGVDNMILVETNEAILLCPADRAQDIKILLEEIKKQGFDKYL